GASLRKPDVPTRVESDEPRIGVRRGYIELGHSLGRRVDHANLVSIELGKPQVSIRRIVHDAGRPGTSGVYRLLADRPIRRVDPADRVSIIRHTKLGEPEIAIRTECDSLGAGFRSRQRVFRDDAGYRNELAHL